MSLLLAALLASIVVNVDLSNGQQLSGKLQELSQDVVSVQLSNGQARRVARSGIKEIRFPNADRSATAKTFVQLIDQSVIACETATLNDGVLRINHKQPSLWQANAKAVRAVRWLQPNEETDEQWNEILTQAGTDDLLVIRRESLDYLKGVILSVAEDAVQFEYSGNKIPVPLSKVAGIVLAKSEVEVPPAGARLTTHNGGQWMLRDLQLAGEFVTIRTTSGVDAKLSLGSISSIEYPQLGAVYISDLEPSDVKVQPYFSSSALSKTLEQLNAPRFDLSYEGLPIRISSEESVSGWIGFQRGVAMQSRTELVYRLAGRYRRFMATAGIAPESPSQADVELKLYADEQEIFSQSVRADAEPIAIDVDVSTARRLKLLVDYGANIDIGDRLHLGDARLIK